MNTNLNTPEQLASFIKQHGEWTAMSIKLSDGNTTRVPAPDHRLRRLLQICSDLAGKPLSQCRVLDLACLEGHYAIEFARHGAEALGIEGRDVSVAKCNFVKEELGLTRASFVKDDVRNLSVAKYGMFDIVICSGLLYHLPSQDAWGLIQAMHAVCKGMVVIDTFVALSSQSTVEVDGVTRHGHVYAEHVEGESEAEKQRKLWASLDNNASFWFTEASLMNMLTHAGFSSTLDVMSPTMPGNLRDRKTYVAMKRERVQVLTSDATDQHALVDIDEGVNPLFDPSQLHRGKLYLAAKHFLPGGVKDAIKPSLRALKILPPDSTPEFQKRRK
jgi:2-polyprenyl-3-methyl-5-hydroxy-6-metoxy-1,4-benzoquinol methylase